MKKMIFVALLLIGSCLIFNNMGYAAGYCGEGIVRIEVVDPTTNLVLARSTVQNALNSLENYYVNQRDRYELCFFFQGTALPLSLPQHLLSFKPLNPTHPTAEVVISGLKLQQDGNLITSPLLTVDYPWAKVIVSDLEMTNVTNGLKVESQTEIVNAHITGAVGSGGSCVELLNSTGSIIRGGDISQCGTGILLSEANSTLIGADSAAKYAQEKTSIDNCGVGIHLVSGSGNRWEYNSIYGNNRDPNILTGEDGIFMELNTNEDIMPPVVAKNTAQGALQCEKDKDGKIISRTIEFAELPRAGRIHLYQTDDYKQGIRYITECGVETDGRCKIENLPAWLDLQETQCGSADLSAVAIFTAESSSSSSYSDTMRFDGYASVISVAAELPASAPEAVDSDSSGSDGESGGATTSGLVGGGSMAAGAAPKCGATLAPTGRIADVTAVVWFLMLMVPCVAIGVLRGKARSS